MKTKWVAGTLPSSMTGSMTLELAGIAEIAEALGVARTTVSTSWADRRDRTGFPEPLTVLSMGPVYDLNAVRAWYERWVSEPQPKKRGSRAGG